MKDHGEGLRFEKKVEEGLVIDIGRVIMEKVVIGSIRQLSVDLS